MQQARSSAARFRGSSAARRAERSWGGRLCTPRCALSPCDLTPRTGHRILRIHASSPAQLSSAFSQSARLNSKKNRRVAKSARRQNVLSLVLRRAPLPPRPPLPTCPPLLPPPTLLRPATIPACPTRAPRRAPRRRGAVTARRTPRRAPRSWCWRRCPRWAPQAATARCPRAADGATRRRLLLQAQLRRPVVMTRICAISSCTPARGKVGGAYTEVRHQHAVAQGRQRRRSGGREGAAASG